MSLTNTNPSQLATIQSNISSLPAKVKTMQSIFTKNYFVQGTYKKEFRDYFYEVGFLTIAVKTILAPLQRWRIIKQTQNAYPLRPKKFKNIIDYIKRIPKQQGYLAFWRGNGAAITLYVTQTLFQIGIYDNMKNYMRKMIQQQQQGSLLSKLLERIIYPIFATVATQAVTYPIDVGRVRLSMNYEKQRSKSYFTSVRTVIMYIKAQEGGFKSVYRGFVLSNVLSFIHLNAFLSLSALFKYASIPAGDKIKQVQSTNLINLQVIASVSALMLIHPIDTVKKLLQLNNNSKPILFNNARGVFKYVQRQMSVSALFNGMQVSIVKTLMFLPVYTACSALLSRSTAQESVQQNL